MVKKLLNKLKRNLKKIIVPGPDEKQLFYDARSKRYFESTLFNVQKAEYYINRELTMRDYVYLNEWYEELDLDIVDDYELGWSTGMCLECYWQNWIDFDHEHFTTDDGRHCIKVSFWQEPMDNFEDYS